MAETCKSHYNAKFNYTFVLLLPSSTEHLILFFRFASNNEAVCTSFPQLSRVSQKWAKGKRKEKIDNPVRLDAANTRRSMYGAVATLGAIWSNSNGQVEPDNCANEDFSGTELHHNIKFPLYNYATPISVYFSRIWALTKLTYNYYLHI